MYHSPYIKVMQQVIQKNAPLLTRDFGEIEQLQSSTKGVEQFSAKSYARMQERLCEALQKAYPSFSQIIVGNGQPYTKPTTEYRLIIYPIFGFANFMRGIPYAGTAIALEHMRGSQIETIACIIDAPFLGETYWAEKGAGAWIEKTASTTRLQQGRIRVGARTDIINSTISTEWPTFQSGSFKPMLQAIERDSIGLRFLAAPLLSLAYVASGKFDAYFHTDFAPHELAAGLLLVKEAGGIAVDFTGKPYNHNAKELIASTPNLEKKFTKQFSA